VGRKQASLQCMGKAADRSRCGRRVKPEDVDATGVPFCNLHRPGAKPHGAVAVQDTEDPMVKLWRMTKSADPQIKLRATLAYLDRLERQATCPRCEDRAARESRMHELFKTLTADECLAASEAIRAVHHTTLRAAYERRPDLMPDWLIQQRLAEERAAQPAPVGTKPLASPSSAETDDDPSSPEEESTYRVDPTEWESVGLFRLRGVVTHADGDATARAILDGSISLDDARQLHRSRLASVQPAIDDLGRLFKGSQS
jgi:hypothetical protein